jgi:hypothetical protein
MRCCMSAVWLPNVLRYMLSQCFAMAWSCVGLAAGCECDSAGAISGSWQQQQRHCLLCLLCRALCISLTGNGRQHATLATQNLRVDMF